MVRYGRVQGDPQRHILVQSITKLEKFQTMCGIENSWVPTLHRATEEDSDQPVCRWCTGLENFAQGAYENDCDR